MILLLPNLLEIRNVLLDRTLPQNQILGNNLSNKTFDSVFFQPFSIIYHLNVLPNLV